MAICKEIVELHGGRIRIESPPPGADRGTVVGIRLPVVEAPKILVADDDAVILDLLVRQLEGRGYRVIRAVSGAEVLDKVGKEKPDVVVLDLVLPEVGGTDVILKMKSRKETMRIPIVVITGAELSRSKVRILNSFSIPALSKPWKEEDLLDRVEGVFLGVAALRG